jgi:hypothetical protein
VSEHKCRVSAGALPILPEEKSGEQSCHTCSGTLFKRVQQYTHSTIATTRLDFLHSRCASISMPGRQANLFKDAKEIINFHMADVNKGMLFVSTFMNCCDKVGID